MIRARTVHAPHPVTACARRRVAHARRAVSAVVLAAAVTGPGACTRAGDAPPLRVMTYNIAAGHGDLNGIARAIRAADPDIVALQEVDVRWSERSDFADQAAELGVALGMHVRFGPIYNLSHAREAGADARSLAAADARPAAADAPTADADARPAPATPDSSVPPPRQFGLAILSREPIVEFTNHVIPRLSTQTEAAEPAPMPGFLEAVVRVGGERVHVFNTHLDYRADPRVRVQQVARMLELMDEGAEPVILMGDLNARPDAPELQPLLARLTDVWSIAAGEGWTYPGATPDRRIDYILVSDHFRVVDAHVPATPASDHRPVVADVRLSRPGVSN